MDRRSSSKDDGSHICGGHWCSIGAFHCARTECANSHRPDGAQTGVVAAGGREIINGFTLFWDSVGNEAGGRKVEIIVEDDASNPDTALQKARRLVEQANVDFLFGNLLANTGLAVANY